MSLKGKLAKMGIVVNPGGTPDSIRCVDLTVTDDLIVNDGQLDVINPAMAASTVMAATLASYIAQVEVVGRIAKTTIYLDLTGAKSTTDDDDIIGDTGACHIGQITTAINGVIFAGQVRCAEVPATGADDINLAAASVATGAYDADVTGLTDAAAIMTAGGAHAIGTVKPFTALPAANSYLYLSCGEDGTVGTYTAGILIIEMLGLLAA